MLRTLRFRLLTTAGALLFLFILTPDLTIAQTIAQAGSQSQHSAVLVELFTSEGCSSCPPADALLAKLEHQQPIPDVDIIVLGEHVDYWDQLGWHDRFSSHQYTERQNQYGSRFGLDSVYTPQMVVDGTEQFVGNDGAHALRAISNSGHAVKIGLALSETVLDGRHMSFTVSSPAPSSALPKADLYAALVDPVDTTDVRRGENGGHVLHHVAVVRSLQRIGKLNDLASGPLKASLLFPENSVPATMRIVVFAERSGQGPVLAAVSVPVKQ